MFEFLTRLDDKVGRRCKDMKNNVEKATLMRPNGTENIKLWHRKEEYKSLRSTKVLAVCQRQTGKRVNTRINPRTRKD